MPHLTPRQRNLIPVVTLMILVCSTAAYFFGVLSASKYKFYDGEGEIIPYRAVDSLVHSQFMETGFSKAGKDTVAAYFPVKNDENKWHSIIFHWDDTHYAALVVNDSQNVYSFIKPCEGRFHSKTGDTSLLQVVGCLQYQFVSTKDSAQIAIDRWNKIYNHD